MSTAPPSNAAAISLRVIRFEIAGSTVYTESELQNLGATLVGKTVPLSEIYALAARITARYGQDGYVLSRAIVPPQSLEPSGSVVRINIIEGFVDQVVWPGGLNGRYRDFFSDYERRIVESRPANIKIIERYLLLASDLPGLKFASTFKPSATKAGASTLVVSVTEKHVAAQASIDNWGSEGRGPWEVRGYAALSNVLGLHEQLGITYATTVPHTDELRYFEGTWKQVLSSEGLTLTLTGSHNTGVPGLDTLQAIQYDSTGTIFTGTLAYPVIRSRDENLTLSGTAFVEDIQSEALASPFTDDRLRGVRGSIEFDNADTFGGINLVHMVVSRGIEGLGSTSNDNAIASRSGGRVDFTKIEVTASHDQTLSAVLPGLSVYGIVYGQYAWDPLLVVEQCAYGGKQFGRAFDPSALTGDSCVDAGLELRYDPVIAGNPLSKTEFYGFVDQGYLNRRTVTAGVPVDQSASSAGAGVRLGWQNNVSLTAEAAHGLGAASGNDWRGHFEFTIGY